MGRVGHDRAEAMTLRWWPDRDPEPGPCVRAVAVEGVDPGWHRWERRPEGWRALGRRCSHAQFTAAKRWHEIGDRPERWRRPGSPVNWESRPVVDMTAVLGEKCAVCEGFGCFGCGWSGRLEHTERRR